MLHALLWAWLAGLALLAITAATTSYRLTDSHQPDRTARIAHAALIGWVAAGFLAQLAALIWEAL